MGYNNITFERTDPLGLVTIDRPERSNAVDYETGQELVGLAAYRYAEMTTPRLARTWLILSVRST